jgi:hypothetical protein
MDKKTKMLLGVGAVAVVGYLVYQQMNKPKGFMNANGGTIFAPQQSGKVFANATAARALPCNGGDGAGGANDLCCKAKKDLVNGRAVCCAGGDASGARSFGCKATNVEATSRGGIVTGKARLEQFGY